MRMLSRAVFGVCSLVLISVTPARAWFGEDLWDAGKDIVEGGVDIVVGAGEAVGGFFSSDYESHDIFCRRYAAMAVSQVQKGRDNSCGFVNGGRFTGDQAAHQTWCLRQAADGNQDTVNDEASARNRAVANCQSCKGVADKARAQAQENLMFNCGGTGPMWSTSFQDQLHQCIGPDGVFAEGPSPTKFAAKPTTIRLASATPVHLSRIKVALGRHLSLDTGPSPEEQRETFLNECKGRQSPEDIVYCKAYAERAVKNGTIWQSRQCGGDDPRFSKDFVHHMSWCMRKENAGLRDQEDQARIQAVDGCKQSHPPKDCKSCHSASANKNSPQGSGGVSLAAMPVDDHSLFSNISAAVRAALTGSGGAYPSRSTSDSDKLKIRRNPAVSLPTASGGADRSRDSGDSPAINRLGGGGGINAVGGGNVGFGGGGRPVPCPTCTKPGQKATDSPGGTGGAYLSKPGPSTPADTQRFDPYRRPAPVPPPKPSNDLYLR